MWKDFAVPEHIKKCSSNEELIVLTNKYNGILPCYCNIYWYELEGVDEYDKEIRNYHIDKVCFDIDGDIESAKKMAKYLLEKDFKFKVNSSGRGWHFYIFTEGKGDSTNLRIAQLSIIHGSSADVDMHLNGDVARILRIPNTWNFKSNSYCVPITTEEIGKEVGKEQRFEKFEYGNKLLHLPDYTEDKYEYIKPEIVKNMNFQSTIVLIPCIRNIIAKANPRHDERFMLAVYLSFALRKGKNLYYFDSKILIDKIIEYMREHCSHWLDFSERETMYYLRNIIPKFNPIVGCRFIKEKGCCIGCIKGGI